MDLDVKITHGHITGQRPGMVLMKPQDQRCFRSTNLRLFHSRRHVLDAPLSNKVTNDRFMLACPPQLATAASIDPNCAIIHESIYSKFPIKFSPRFVNPNARFLSSGRSENNQTLENLCVRSALGTRLACIGGITL